MQKSNPQMVGKHYSDHTAEIDVGVGTVLLSLAALTMALAAYFMN